MHKSYKGIKSLFYKHNGYKDRDTIDVFFKKIDNGQLRLANFTSDLSTYLKLLNEGETLTVVLRGFASPLGPKDEGSYNYALSKRRIDNIRQYFKNHLPSDEYAKLRVVAVPNGDKKAPNGTPNRGFKAIFGLDSSEERRVEIIALRLSPGACLDLDSIPTESY
jgi:outer membrane protein OmpA-like peptidoglycan-associated protein